MVKRIGLVFSLLCVSLCAFGESVFFESILGDSVLRFQIKLPPIVDTEVSMIPLPKYHPSPLAPFPAWKRPEFDHPTADDEKVDEYQDEVYEAAVYCNGAMADVFPTLAFYTSEDQFESRIHNDSMLIFDDIHWSSGMEEAWQYIQNHPRVTVSIDTFQWRRRLCI